MIRFGSKDRPVGVVVGHDLANHHWIGVGVEVLLNVERCIFDPDFVWIQARLMFNA